MVNEHGTHGEARPVDTILVDLIACVHLVDGLADKELVARAACVPCAAVAAQIGNDKLGRVDHLVHLVGAILVFWVLVHAVRHNEER